MTAKQIIETIRNHRGQMTTATWESIVPSLKSARDVTVTKRTTAHVVAGVEYQNRREIREAIEAGERGEVQPLPWGQWVEYPYIIGHTRKDGSYHEYVRLYPPTEAQAEAFHLRTEVQFFANGAPITREMAIAYCGAKAEKDDERPACFAPDVANIIQIG